MNSRKVTTKPESEIAEGEELKTSAEEPHRTVIDTTKTPQRKVTDHNAEEHDQKEETK
jgi:hypothetical protein